ncbi:MAG: SDR family NAD(P)-dependent oxidoreductase [Chloroflexi bacterium]|nr:SDR family NAD(P)-dependent oxidoreductase [Chloroflexota bacterium]
MDLELEGKLAIVTGGSRGIGKAIAWELAREGCEVAICARNADALQATADEIADDTGRDVYAIECNTTDTESVTSMVARANFQLGGIDILVNNAARPLGQAPVPGIEGVTDEAFNEDINTKVLGYLRCARAVAPIMKERGWGRIINISGLASRSSGSAVGSIRNVSVSALTKNLADELGPFGINAVVIHPGATRTEATPRVAAARAEAAGVSVEEILEEMASANSVRKLIDAREIAYVAAFVASPKAVAITGDAIAAGGGVGNAIHY